MSSRHQSRLLIAALCFCAGLISMAQAELQPAATASPAPAFPAEGQWLNGEPQRWSELAGNVVLMDFWTFACWNCYRSFPWLNELEQRLSDKPFRVIGVHSPEFDYEKQRQRLAGKIAQFKLQHPILIDNEHRYWNAIGNRYWPTFYLIDKQGRIRGVYIGEMQAGSATAKELEADIATLLAE